MTFGSMSASGPAPDSQKARRSRRPSSVFGSLIRRTTLRSTALRLAEDLERLFPRVLLGARRDPVLQVDADDIGTGGKGFLVSIGPARREKRGSCAAGERLCPSKFRSYSRTASRTGPGLRARHGITVPFWPPMHPGGLRCSSLTDSRYARSSRLASRAPRHPVRHTYSVTGPTPPRWHTSTCTLAGRSRFARSRVTRRTHHRGCCSPGLRTLAHA